jgi:hypothetical protein
MDRKLLKEAIADAKTIKEAAIANAKSALEEAFTPQLKSMFAAKIQELENNDMDEAYNEEENMEENMDFTNEMEEEDLGELNLDEEEMDEEFNLDELLAELEGLDEEESTEENLNEAEEESEDEEMSDEDMDAETLDLENMTDEDLKSFIEDVIRDMVQAGELEANDEDMEEEEEEEEVDIDELLAEARKAKKTKKAEKVEDKEEDSLKEELRRSQSSIEKLTKELNEVNLLNAKLLYINKIFKSNALTENQKIKVLSSMDRATSVKEVKLVYESLLTGLKPAKSTIKENINFASKTMISENIKAKQNNDIIDPQLVAKFKKIAGIE